MSFWLELHCDKLCDGKIDYMAACRTHRNDNPAIGSLNTCSALLATKKHVEKSARSGGWKKTKDGWICPGCQRYGDKPERER
jgi:hypothetical protein